MLIDRLKTFTCRISCSFFLSDWWPRLDSSFDFIWVFPLLHIVAQQQQWKCFLKKDTSQSEIVYKGPEKLDTIIINIDYILPFQKYPLKKCFERFRQNFNNLTNEREISSTLWWMSVGAWFFFTIANHSLRSQNYSISIISTLFVSFPLIDLSW